MKPLQFKTIFTILLLAIYATFIIQYLYNRSLWNDEALLALNIIEKSFTRLFQPLDHYQIAPVLFLQIEKLATLVFGNSEYALRLFPLISAMLSVPLCYSVCLVLTGNRILSLATMILLGCTPGLLYYSSEVKQYSTDLFVTLLLYASAFLPSLHNRRSFWMAIAGSIAVFLSNVSIITLFVLGIYFVYIMVKNKKVNYGYLLSFSIWTILFGINFLLFVKNHPHAAYMKSYWKSYFMPLNITGIEFRRFVNRSTLHIFKDLLPSLPSGFLFLSSVALYIAGITILFYKRKIKLLYLCVAPVVIHLVLSALKLYPFDQRLILYQAPFYLLIMAYALVTIINKFVGRSAVQIAILSLSIFLLSFKTYLEFPVEHDEIKPAIRYINQYSNKNESLYLFYGAARTCKYYMITGLAKFDQLKITNGAPRQKSINDYLQDLDTLKGPVWLLASHMYPYHGNRDEELAVIKTLQKRGELIREAQFRGSSVYYFNLR